MSLQEFASIGAAMSGVGVMLGVVYFGIELHHNTRAMRVSALQQVINSFASVSFDIAKDKNLVDLFLRAGRDYAALSEVEHTQYSLMLLSYLRRAESVHFQTQIHVLRSDHWSGIRNSIKSVLATPGARTCWSEIQNRFNPEFCNFVNALIAEN